MVDLALKMLLHDKVKFFITVAGVAFAVTLVLVQVGLFIGLLDNATVTIENTHADIWVTSKETPNIDFAHQFSDSYVERVRSAPGVAKADNLIVNFLTISLPSGAQEGVIVYGLRNFRDWNLPWNVEEGNLNDLRRGRFLFLDDSAVRRYGPFAVNQYREIQQTRFKIIGRTSDAKSFTTTPIAFMDFDRAQALSSESLQGQTSYVLVKVAPGADVKAVKAEIQRRLPHNDVYLKDEWARRSRNYWIVSTGLGLNLFVTVFLGCMVGLVVVAQTLYSSTMEHIKEFGTVKAIGGGNGDIYRLLAEQATVAAAVGYLLGVAQAFAVQPLVHKIDLKLMIPDAFLLVVFIGSLVMCLGAALISFRKVAGIDPALVFRT
ncbi:MAG TPA: ABC transporter permease [Terriglobales bacterium]|nr:ABC transporter permease [Terriglobales bacterium]